MTTTAFGMGLVLLGILLSMTTALLLNNQARPSRHTTSTRSLEEIAGAALDLQAELRQYSLFRSLGNHRSDPFLRFTMARAEAARAELANIAGRPPSDFPDYFPAELLAHLERVLPTVEAWLATSSVETRPLVSVRAASGWRTIEDAEVAQLRAGDYAELRVETADLRLDDAALLALALESLEDWIESLQSLSTEPASMLASSTPPSSTRGDFSEGVQMELLRRVGA